MNSTNSTNSTNSFERRLLSEWKRLLPENENHVIVAVSGGADSSALLLALVNLRRAGRIKSNLTAAHLDHGLRGRAGHEDAGWIAELVRELDIECDLERTDVKRRADESRDNLEQAARRARYEFLERAARRRRAVAVATAHTMDDQAETMLLRLLRGSGSEGLGAMTPLRRMESSGDVLLVRPLLRWARRTDTETYCREKKVSFRIDAMNDDETFARVKVRKQLLPLMKTFNPRIVEALSRSADLLHADAAALRVLAGELLARAEVEVADKETSATPALNVNIIVDAPEGIRRRALRLWIARGRGGMRRLELSHLVAVEKLLLGERGGRIAELPGGCRVERRKGQLIFLAEKVEKANAAI